MQRGTGANEIAYHLPGLQVLPQYFTSPGQKEILTGYLLSLLEHGDHIASPSDISTIHADDGFSSLVSCDINQYKDTKAVKKTLTIPSWLNDRAISMGINFSQALQEALLSKIQA